MADVVVTPESPLYVTDGNRTFGTVTVEPGGQVFVQATADVTVDSYVIQS